MDDRSHHTDPFERMLDKAEDENKRLAGENEQLRALVREARDLLVHDPDHGQGCAGCRLEFVMDEVLGGDESEAEMGG